jgi:hypothetical protein
MCSRRIISSRVPVKSIGKCQSVELSQDHHHPDAPVGVPPPGRIVLKSVMTSLEDCRGHSA